VVADGRSLSDIHHVSKLGRVDVYPATAAHLVIALNHGAAKQVNRSCIIFAHAIKNDIKYCADYEEVRVPWCGTWPFGFRDLS